MRMLAGCALALALAGCGGGNQAEVVPAKAAPTPARGAVPWPAPKNPMALTQRAGLTPETHEFVFLHVHAHLDVFVNGKPVTVPAGIGIDVDNPAVKRFQANDGSTGYGGISPPCAKPCISPLHTHFADGVLHTEAKEHEFNTLGEFFTEWDVRLDPTCIGGYCKPAAPIAVYVDGKPITSDPRAITLEDQREIAIVIGSPPAKIPSSFGGG
ncbi:MAG TPA: hypothetical protein VFU26_06685 [Gaiellaceae bacterium]|nr:hypothetical protein [Gaiellaceae bacterium]